MLGSSTQTPMPGLASFADLLAIPEDQRRHEILDGEIVPKARSGGEHGLGQLCVGRLLDPFGRKPGGSSRPGGWWLVCDVEVELSSRQVVRNGDDRRRDELQKRRTYADCGVPHYWLLDTERERLTVLRLTASGCIKVLDVGRPERVRAEPSIHNPTTSHQALGGRVFGRSLYAQGGAGCALDS